MYVTKRQTSDKNVAPEWDEKSAFAYLIILFLKELTV